MLVIRNAPGYAAVESRDGKFIFVTAGNLGVWRVAVEGGEPRRVLDSIASFDPYAEMEGGINFITGSDPTKGHSLRFLELATGKIKTIAELGRPACANLSLSPDGRWALYTQADQSGSDLMLVENFR